DDAAPLVRQANSLFLKCESLMIQKRQAVVAKMIGEERDRFLASRDGEGRGARKAEGPARSAGPCKEFWCRQEESNPRPSHYECAALPTELCRRAWAQCAFRRCRAQKARRAERPRS